MHRSKTAAFNGGKVGRMWQILVATRLTVLLSKPDKFIFVWRLETFHGHSFENDNKN
jgi:hypothetical protein